MAIEVNWNSKIQRRRRQDDPLRHLSSLHLVRRLRIDVQSGLRMSLIQLPLPKKRYPIWQELILPRYRGGQAPSPPSLPSTRAAFQHRQCDQRSVPLLRLSLSPRTTRGSHHQAQRPHGFWCRSSRAWRGIVRLEASICTFLCSCREGGLIALTRGSSRHWLAGGRLGKPSRQTAAPEASTAVFIFGSPQSNDRRSHSQLRI